LQAIIFIFSSYFSFRVSSVQNLPDELWTFQFLISGPASFPTPIGFFSKTVMPLYEREQGRGQKEL
jgi:hypothetical protein